ncbi:MAG: 4-(cytidine 5'-diphospho)-2-C-methyl-D-erythritol kinase [Firmicutes bacterium]|nr:4-(cytidine 5'-diphospho)-2-C-methyl-D-erythritol kinase [[Eubacterium] siraeum]MCM1488991.1 4-(cytidine 5'-diphospho)-2-C-methyl-D-erythritol kinase [Bacillota bacterium]
MSSRVNTVTVPAYAKINLFLDIVGVLPNGYHSINTIMQQIDLCDTVTVSFEEARERRIEVYCDDPEIPCDERNIAFKAAELFMKRAGVSGRAVIRIEKHIPIMAGLGGSSTDGGAVLKSLNAVQEKRLTRDRLEELGAELGADVPFCLRGGTALCEGIGERMTDIPTTEQCSIILVKPDFSCNTAEAYKLYDKAPVRSLRKPEKTVSALKIGDTRAVGKGLYNVFEELYGDPRIKRIKEELISLGALGASLSGSGSAVFGIFADESAAVGASGRLSYPFVRVCRGIRRSDPVG